MDLKELNNKLKKVQKEIDDVKKSKLEKISKSEISNLKKDIKSIKGESESKKARINLEFDVSVTSYGDVEVEDGDFAHGVNLQFVNCSGLSRADGKRLIEMLEDYFDEFDSEYNPYEAYFNSNKILKSEVTSFENEIKNIQKKMNDFQKRHDLTDAEFYNVVMK